MSDIIIRKCVPEDYKEICGINKSALGYDFPADRTKNRLELILNSDGNVIFGAFQGGRMLGYIHGSDYECTYQESMKNVMALAVEGEFRGAGVGRMLLERLEAWAAEDGCTGVRLVSGMNRTKAHGFYEHCGYFMRKEQKNFMKIF